MYKKIYRNMCFLSMLTLLVATVMILSVCYVTFNTRLKDEIKNEALFIADFLQENPNAISTLDNLHRDNRRITLIAADGTVLYDNDAPVGTLDDHSARPEIQAAAENGFGEAERYSMTLATTVYYYAIRLPDGSIVRLASTTHNILAIFFNVLMLVLFIAAFIYIFSIIIAGRLTDNIVKPIGTPAADRKRGAGRGLRGIKAVFNQNHAPGPGNPPADGARQGAEKSSCKPLRTI